MKGSPLYTTLLAAGFGAVFCADYLGWLDHRSQPVAQVGELKGSLKTLRSNNMSWNWAIEGTLLENGDTISSGENSKATLDFFNNEGKLFLDEGTTVVVGRKLDHLELAVLSGGAELYATPELEKKFDVQVPEQSHYKVKRVRREEMFKVHPIATGAAKHSAQTPIKTVFGNDQSKNFMQLGGDVVKDENPGQVAQLISPVLGQELKLKSVSQPVTLKWENADSQFKKFVVFVQSGDGLRKRSEIEVTGHELRLQKLPTGKYFWWVRSVDESGSTSNVSTQNWFKVSSNSAALESGENFALNDFIEKPEKPIAKVTPKKIIRSTASSLTGKKVEIFPVKVK